MQSDSRISSRRCAEATDEQIAVLVGRLSAGRLSIYRAEAKERGAEDISRHALELHIWNTWLSSALHGTLESFEVVLRNAIDSVLTEELGEDWYDKSPWSGSPKLKAARRVLEEQIYNARYQESTGKGHILYDARKKIRQGVNHDNMIAQLDFSYWCNLYEVRRFRPTVRKIFSSLPASTKSSDIIYRLHIALELKKMILRYEPVFLLDVPRLEDQLIEFISWICPITARWIKDNSTVTSVFELRPSS